MVPPSALAGSERPMGLVVGWPSRAHAHKHSTLGCVCPGERRRRRRRRFFCAILIAYTPNTHKITKYTHAKKGGGGHHPQKTHSHVHVDGRTSMAAAAAATTCATRALTERGKCATHTHAHADARMTRVHTHRAKKRERSPPATENRGYVEYYKMDKNAHGFKGTTQQRKIK